MATSSCFAGRLFYGSNGITISADRRTVYVNDPTDLRISVMHRDPASGHLRQGFWKHPHPPPRNPATPPPHNPQKNKITLLRRATGQAVRAAQKSWVQFRHP
jgi:hypothetical protein